MTLLAAACSGGDSLADYVSATAAITEQMTRDAFAALPPGAAPTHQQVTAVVAVRRHALEEITALTAPDEMEPEHLALIHTMGEFVAAGEAFVAETADLDANAFVTALEESTAIDALADLVNAACAAWESRAADLGQAVELGC